jgi:phosphotriesterase-related protein
VNIIAVTGWWGDLHHFLAAVSIDQWAEAFIREVKEGIGGTGIKPGLLKAANDITGVTPAPPAVTDWAYIRLGETMLRAIARAHLATGVPIVIHSYPTNRVGLQQTAVLKEEGVDLRRVLVAHSNDTTDVEYLLMLLEQGCYLGMDRYPGDVTYVSPQARTKTLKALIDAGYADHVLPSHDWPEAVPFPREFMEAYNPDSFLYIHRKVLPQLKEMGVSDETIKKMFVDGPRNFFEGV